jgi:hypothetical protein
MRRGADLAVPAVAAAACLVAPPLILLGVHSPVRVAATLVVMVLAPGTALLGPRALGLIVGTSLAVCVVAAEGMLALGVWAPRAATVAVAIISLPVLVIRSLSEVGNGPAAMSERQQRRR